MKALVLVQYSIVNNRPRMLDNVIHWINKRETNCVIRWISAIHLLNNWSLLYLYR